MRCLNEKASAAGWVVAFCQCPLCESLRAGTQPGPAVEPDPHLKELQALRAALTWGEFKAWMEANGVEDDDVIGHFDIVGMPLDPKPKRWVDRDEGQMVSVE